MKKITSVPPTAEPTIIASRFSEFSVELSVLGLGFVEGTESVLEVVGKFEEMSTVVEGSGIKSNKLLNKFTELGSKNRI